jgi:predicted PurR-regulated permease PerM
MEEKDIKALVIPFVILLLAFISFFILRPISGPIFLGLLFAYILHPVYKRVNKRLNSKYLSASIVLVLTLCIIIIPTIILAIAATPQVLSVYSSVTNFDIASILNKVAPSLLQNQAVSAEVQAASSEVKSAISGWILNYLKNTIINIPSIMFGIVILLFTFFFAMIESDKFKDYFSVIFPFPKDYRDKFYDKFNQIADSVIYGHFIIGLAQGLIAGVGYYILGVPQALLLTVLTVLAGILPVIGPSVIWGPVDVYLFIQGHTGIAMGLLIYGLFVISWVDTLLRPQIVASRAQMNSAIALIGTIGGMYAFGAMGLIIGPIVLGNLILLIELYKDKGKEPSIVIVEQKPEQQAKPA